MDPEKRGSSTEEDDQLQPTTKRSYECTFCKRGFTNAQALGGHMNIHRKDRAKAKTSAARPSISSEPAKYYPLVEPRRACFVGALRMNEELWGANLSLGVGPAEVEGNDLMMKRYMRKEDEIDLELRLGHYQP